MGKKKTQPIRILTVDDDPLVVETIRMVLQHSGYEVDAAFHGAEALEKVKENPPDLILLDVAMPVKDGFQTLKELRGNPVTRYLPVLMLTGMTGEADEVKGWRLGVDLYLHKPFHPDDLIRQVKKALEARNEEIDPYELT